VHLDEQYHRNGASNQQQRIVDDINDFDNHKLCTEESNDYVEYISVSDSELQPEYYPQIKTNFDDSDYLTGNQLRDSNYLPGIRDDGSTESHVDDSDHLTGSKLHGHNYYSGVQDDGSKKNATDNILAIDNEISGASVDAELNWKQQQQSIQIAISRMNEAGKHKDRESSRSDFNQPGATTVFKDSETWKNYLNGFFRGFFFTVLYAVLGEICKSFSS